MDIILLRHDRIFQSTRFYRPTRICKFGNDCRDRDACPFRHVGAIPCKFGERCTKGPLHCPFRHDDDEASASLKAKTIQYPTKTSKSKKTPKREKNLPKKRDSTNTYVVTPSPTEEPLPPTEVAPSPTQQRKPNHHSRPPTTTAAGPATPSSDPTPPTNQDELMAQLFSMGFDDETAVLKALQESQYRLDRTVTALLVARETEILRIQEATRVDRDKATEAFETNAGEILRAIRSIRVQQRASIQFATTEEVETAVFCTNRTRKQERAQRRNEARRLRKRVQKRLHPDDDAVDATVEPILISNANDYAMDSYVEAKEAAGVVPTKESEVVAPTSGDSRNSQPHSERNEAIKMKRAEKRAKQKQRRHEQFLAAQQEKLTARSTYWAAFVERQDRMVDVMTQLCVAEFCCKNDTYEASAVLQMTGVQSLLHHACRACLSRLETPLKVSLEDGAHFGGRTGIIDHWDAEKQKFCVTLRNKKSKADRKVYVAPEHLEAEQSSVTSRRPIDRSVAIEVDSLLDGIRFATVIFHSEVKILLEAKSVSIVLEEIIVGRREEERLEREREETLRQEEERLKARRQRQKEREQEEWEAHQREFEERQRQYEAYRTDQRRSQKAHSRRTQHATRCHCPECKLQGFFFSFMGEGFFVFSGSGNTNGSGFSFVFEDEDDDDDDFYNRRWNNLNRQEIDDKKAADCLGVAVDASVDEIKRVYRRKALRYHPDKYRAEDHNLTAEEAEDHFKELNSAYDHLLSNFD